MTYTVSSGTLNSSIPYLYVCVCACESNIKWKPSDAVVSAAVPDVEGRDGVADVTACVVSRMRCRHDCAVIWIHSRTFRSLVLSLLFHSANRCRIATPPPRNCTWQDIEKVAKICLLHRTPSLSAQCIIIVVNERPRKTKIGTEVAHVTPDSDTTFKVKRSKSPGRFGWLYWQPNVDIQVTYPHAYMTSCHHLQAWAGAYRGGRPPTACLCGRMC